ncbi:MAG TPA: BadF/BadG/BcrA/BcrD ATPase family protein [Micromonosporaceae bacterium]
MAEYVIGVDGGNSKTDVVIASTDGELLARLRGPGVASPLANVAGWRDALTTLVDDARRRANVGLGTRALAAAYFLANVDLPNEHRVAQHELAAATPAETTVVHNDALAVLRAGGTRPWGVAVVAGAGINAIGVDETGRTEGFLALGDITGDSGGGHDLGVKALGAAMRARDGRGPQTALAVAVPAHFNLGVPEDVAVAVHDGAVAYGQLHTLAPILFATAADGDAVSRRILDDFADEVATMANALIERLDLAGTDVEVVLGGGTLHHGNRDVFERVAARVTAVAPQARVTVLDVSPVYGALVEAFRVAGVVSDGSVDVRELKLLRNALAR